VFVSLANGGTSTLAIVNNTIREYNAAGIFADNTGGTYAANFTITGNTTNEPAGGAFAGLLLSAGATSSSDDVDVCAQIGGSTAAERNDFSAGDPSDALDVYVSVGAPLSSIRLPGYAGTTLTDVQNFIFGNNSVPGTTVTANADPPATAANFTGGASCPTP
jgi:hypothetical protein